jgi:hypothetical protein
LNLTPLLFFAKTENHVDCFRQVAAVEIRITADRYVLDEFFSWGLSIGIAFKYSAVCHLYQKQAGLAVRDLNVSTLTIAQNERRHG